ncbi:GNAT family N-acetyltransferase [Candidatus Woesearchaeota archaeon]|jgi:ribosomal protein S18 acetylase RimI-like enzyme|nr:GNAT family N-acetyltransferase [Candidatus Woesearchaeota archaeon]MBT6774438.1 GNAT family N-acetyltransferase [Candidatus Woesearchaeota archaeon]
MTLKLRIAKKSDIPGIVNVMDKVGYTKFRFKKMSLNKVQATLQIEFSNRTFLVCVDNKNIIGYAIFGPAEAFLNPPFEIKKKNFAYHLGIGIDPDYQRKGIGLLLTEFMEKVIHAEKYKGIYSDVSSNNTISLKLQKKMGFVEIKRYSDSKRTKGTRNVLFKKEF